MNNDAVDTGKKVTFCGFKCDVFKDKYRNNGRTALLLIASDDDSEKEIFKGEDIATATCNLTDEDINPACVCIKDWSESEGMVDILMDAGVVSQPVKFVSSGHVQVPVCFLLV